MAQQQKKMFGTNTELGRQDSEQFLIVRNMLHHIPKGETADAEEAEIAQKVVQSKLKAGGVFLKWGRNEKSKYRAVWCSDDLQRVLWGEPKNVAREPSDAVSVKEITEVTSGHKTELFRKVKAKTGGEDKCFSLIAADRTLDLEAVSQQERDLWVLAFQSLLKKDKPAAVRQPSASTASQRDSLQDVKMNVETPRLSPDLMADQINLLKAKLNESVPRSQLEKSQAELEQAKRDLAAARAAEKKAKEDTAAALEAKRYAEEELEPITLPPVQVPVADEKTKQELREAKTRLEQAERKLQHLTLEMQTLKDAHDALLAQRDKLMHLSQQEDQLRYITQELDSKQNELEEALRRVRILERTNEVLESREARRTRMVWALEEEQSHAVAGGTGEDSDDEDAEGPTGAEVPQLITVPWSPAQQLVLERQKQAVNNKYPQARWVNLETQSAQLVVPVVITTSVKAQPQAGEEQSEPVMVDVETAYQFTVILEGYPLKQPKLLLTAPTGSACVDAHGAPLLNIGENESLGLLKPYHGFPQLKHRGHAFIKDNAVFAPHLDQILEDAIDWATKFDASKQVNKA